MTKNVPTAISASISTFTLYELPVGGLTLGLGPGHSFDAGFALANGRASYVIFEGLVQHLCGLTRTTGSDHKDAAGRTYEQKSFVDAASGGKDLFQTSASCTFAANNKGPVIKALLAAGDYAGALDVCRKTGYDKNDFYVYTNTGGFDLTQPLRFMVVPTSFVLANLDPVDPRRISRSTLLAAAVKTVQL